MANINTYAARKGGPGKTTVSTHDAFYKALIKEKKVLMIDLDGQRNAGSKMLRNSNVELSAITAERLFVDVPINDMIVNKPITIIAASNEAFDQIDKSDNSIIANFIKRVQEVSPYFDEVIIDTPPTVLLRVQAAMCVSDFVTSVVEHSDMSDTAVDATQALITAISKKANPRLQHLGIIVNKYQVTREKKGGVFKKFVNKYKEKLFACSIKHRMNSYEEALNQGVPVWEVKTSSAKEAGKDMFTFFEQCEERARKLKK